MPKYKKLNPNIIRVDDMVKIINPIFVIRCGYPMSLDDARKEIIEEYSKVIDDLVYSVRQGNKFMISKNGYYENGSCALLNKEEYQKDNYKHYKIVDALAYERLISKNFGGNTRSLHTEIKEELKGIEARVLSIQYVKTGIRVPSSRYYDSYNGGYEYEQGYLDKCETHKILNIGVIRQSNKLWDAWEAYDLKIEAIHVEKIPNIQETPVEYNHRIKFAEKQRNRYATLKK